MSHPYYGALTTDRRIFQNSRQSPVITAASPLAEVVSAYQNIRRTIASILHSSADNPFQRLIIRHPILIDIIDQVMPSVSERSLVRRR
jgi:hypothetical protein